MDLNHNSEYTYNSDTFNNNPGHYKKTPIFQSFSTQSTVNYHRYR